MTSQNTTRRKKAMLMGGFLLLGLWFGPQLPGRYWYFKGDNDIRRGARLAREQGCLSCHGPRGAEEIANSGTETGSIPSFWRGSLMMFADNRQEVENWIRYGQAEPPGKDGSGPGEDQAVFHMAPFGERLSDRQVEQLAAFVAAADGFEVPGEVRAGYELSRTLGCESCHGVAGAGGPPNPGSFTGFVPGWLGDDFSHLVEGRPDFDEWVLEGRSKRFKQSALASYFLDRANLKMPAFGSVLRPSDVDSLRAYIQWLRGHFGGRRELQTSATGSS